MVLKMLFFFYFINLIHSSFIPPSHFPIESWDLNSFNQDEFVMINSKELGIKPNNQNCAYKINDAIASFSNDERKVIIQFNSGVYIIEDDLYLQNNIILRGVKTTEENVTFIMKETKEIKILGEKKELTKRVEILSINKNEITFNVNVKNLFRREDFLSIKTDVGEITYEIESVEENKMELKEEMKISKKQILEIAVITPKKNIAIQYIQFQHEHLEDSNIMNIEQWEEFIDVEYGLNMEFMNMIFFVKENYVPSNYFNIKNSHHVFLKHMEFNTAQSFKKQTAVNIVGGRNIHIYDNIFEEFERLLVIEKYSRVISFTYNFHYNSLKKDCLKDLECKNFDNDIEIRNRVESFLIEGNKIHSIQIKEKTKNILIFRNFFIGGMENKNRITISSFGEQGNNTILYNFFANESYISKNVLDSKNTYLTHNLINSEEYNSVERKVEARSKSINNTKVPNSLIRDWDEVVPKWYITLPFPPFGYKEENEKNKIPAEYRFLNGYQSGIIFASRNVEMAGMISLLVGGVGIIFFFVIALIIGVFFNLLKMVFGKMHLPQLKQVVIEN